MIEPTSLTPRWPAALTMSARPAVAHGDLGTMFSQALADASSTIRNAETVSIDGIHGAAPISKVVEAVMDAQQTLQTMIAIRDKAIAAYQEITRMAI